MQYQHEQGESEYHDQGIWGLYSSIFPLKQAHTAGIFLQDQIRVADQFFATVGLRIDHHSQFGTEVTYRLAPAYYIQHTGTKLKITYGTGFKSPSLYQLYAPGTLYGSIGNEDLNPEKSTGWDSGFEQHFLKGKIVFGATYFFNVFKDLINFDFAKGYINIGRAESKGAELFIHTHPIKELVLKASYTKTDAKDKDTDTPLLRRPKHKLAVTLGYNFLEKGDVNLSLFHVGEREDVDTSSWPSSQVTLPSYTLLNTAFSFDITPHIQIFIRLDNVLNVKYEMLKGYGTPGFSFYSGATISF